jgi:PKD repeat protein
MKIKLLTSVSALLLIIFATAQQPVFLPAEESAIAIDPGTRKIIPQKYQLLSVDFNAIKTYLNQAPNENIPGGLAIALPLPDGTSEVFEIWNYSMMEEPFASAHPYIKTFLGRGKTNPYATIRLDYTLHGFHAYILSPFGTISIDPYAANNTQYYIVYYKKDLSNIHAEHFSCHTEESGFLLPVDNDNKTLFPNGGTRREYRLALACTGEYATFHGGTVAGVASEMVTAMNRVNGVYEREFAARMNIVGNNNSLIYLNSSTDPYTNNNGGTMLGQNQTACNNVIGSANYDIGHVFSTGGGGVAYLASLCDNNKAGGVTGLPSPVGDPFYIDYVAHEMGHQFNGSHTFNSSNGSCGGGNRSTNDAYEPGSGSTIMAYAGICSPDDIQNNSDDYFHARSYRTIYTEIVTNEPSCPTTFNTGNNPPTVNAGVGGKSVPTSTPFKLKASGSDADGDALTFCWEQYDLGSSIALATAPTSGTPPLFRSYDPDTSSTRYFPRLQTVINNSSDNKERIPTYTRVMTFRCTARDNRPNSGGVSFDTIGYNFTSLAGPFTVSSPNTTGDYWLSNSSQTVTWNVANTNASPVNCATVNIRLSIDGGFTYPYLLIAGTPNDGSQAITVPAIPNSYTTCRVMVESVNNIFYDISNANFTVAPGAPSAPVASFTASDLDVCQGQFVNFSDQSTNTPTSWSWSFGGGNPSTSSLQNPTNIQFNTAGTYAVSLTASNITGSNTYQQNITVNPLPAATFTFIPANNSLSNGSVTANPTGGTPPYTYQWISSPIQNGQTASNLPAGNIGVTITDAKGCSRNYNVTIPDNTALTNDDLLKSISVFPNPANDYINIQFTYLASEKINVSLINGLGQIIRTVDCSNQMNEIIPVYDLSSGWYLIKIEADGIIGYRSILIAK